MELRDIETTVGTLCMDIFKYYDSTRLDIESYRARNLNLNEIAAVNTVINDFGTFYDDITLYEWITNQINQINKFHKKAEHLIIYTNLFYYKPEKDDNTMPSIEDFSMEISYLEEFMSKDFFQLETVLKQTLSGAKTVNILHEVNVDFKRTKENRQRSTEQTKVLNKDELGFLVIQLIKFKVITTENRSWIANSIAPICGFSEKKFHNTLIESAVKPNEKQKENLKNLLLNIIENL